MGHRGGGIVTGGWRDEGNGPLRPRSPGRSEVRGILENLGKKKPETTRGERMRADAGGGEEVGEVKR